MSGRSDFQLKYFRTQAISSETNSISCRFFPRRLIRFAGVALACSMTTALWTSIAFGQSAPNPERRPVLPDLGLSAEKAQRLIPDAGFQLKAANSLLISEIAVLERLSFHDVMEKLAEDARSKGDQTATAEKLFDDWWDSQGTSNAANSCSSTVNGFPFDCPRPEAGQKSTDAFGEGAGKYILTAAVNRLDLRDGNWADCGEHRLIFALMAGADGTPLPLNRNLIIFEASVPNPFPEQGAAGCQGIAQFWYDQSDPGLSIDERALALRDVFLNGWLPGNPNPIISLDNYGFHVASSPTPSLVRPAGQIRSNQFMGGPDSGWLLREFKPQSVNVSIAIRQQILAANPEPSLFAVKVEENDTDKATKAAKLGAALISQLEQLTIDDINKFNSTTPLTLNTADGHSQNSKGNYAVQFDSAGADGIVENLLSATPLTVRKNLSPKQIVNRVRAMSCGGCHDFSNDDPDLGLSNGDKWPKSAGIGFVHVDETNSVNGSFSISEALSLVFLKARMAEFKKTFLGES